MSIQQNVRKLSEKESKKRTCIFTYNPTLEQFSISANQSPGFFVSGSSTPIGLFHAINGLKRLVCYSKWLH